MMKNDFTIKPRHVLFYLCLFTLLFYQHTYGQTLPAGFSRVQVASGLVQTTAMETAPDGRVFVCEQAGKLRVIKNGVLLSTPAVTLTNVDFADEKGLIGVVVDPAFSTNNLIYLYYTVKEGAERANGFNRIVRYKMNGDVVDASTRTIIYDLSDLKIGTRYHSGGSMIFGKDGKLYVGTGENQQGSTNSQSLDNTHGKILRMNPDGSIPTGNPFTGNSAKSRIWVYGLRNAFTFDINKVTGKIYVNDVGGALREEINDATTSGKNFGWAEQEGTCTSGCTGYTNPIYDYFRENETTDQTYRIDQGCAITGGVFFNPTSNYPSTYQGKYFFLDFCNNWINYIDPANTAAGIKNFAKMMGWHNVYLKVGADGNLYYLCRGPGRLNTNSIVYKIVFSGGSSPTITQQPVSTTVAQGDPATFTVVASGSPPLTYQWRKNGVNIPGATSSTYTISNTQPTDAGTYSVVVSNSVQPSATSNDATLTVTAPNNRPIADITAPPTNSTYRYGDVFNYVGDATDTEDGPLPASAFTWDLVLHHNTHAHNDADLPDGVKTGSFTANNDHIDGDVYYELFLTVRDSKGAIGMDSIRVNPITSNLTLQTNPAGLQIRFDLQPRNTPFTSSVVSNSPTPIEAISPQTVNGVTYIFDSWSNGVTTASQTITPTDNDATYTANFRVAPTPVLLAPTNDAYVRDGTNAGITFGTTDPTVLITKVSPTGQLNNARESYLMFDAASVTGTISSATLRVYGKVDLTTTPSVPVGVFSVANTTWTESTITWNNKPASGSTALSTVTVTNTAFVYYDFDVTSYVQSERAAGRTKVSFAMKSLAAHDPRIFWNSKEFGSNPPQLSIIAESGNANPTASITAPANGTTFTTPATITIDATAADSDGTIAKVEFFRNGTILLGEDLAAPYSFTWSNAPTGSHTLTARATDNEGGVGTSSGVTITVQNTAPTVSITSPLNGATFTVPATVDIAANASDANGSVVKVEFFQGTTKLGEDLTSPYSFTWSDVAAGNYALTAMATDDLGTTTTSSVVNISVQNPPSCEPVIASADDGNVAANVLDNNLATRWSAFGDLQWIQFCLSSPQTINGVQIAFYKGNERSTRFDIFLSQDGIDFTPVQEGLVSSGTSLNLETFTITPQTTKYIRILGHGNSANLWNSFTEVEIMLTTNAVPTVAITSPSNNATFTTPATVTINATAADSDGTVTKVEFFNGTTKLGEDLTDPYSFIWSNVPPGTHSLTAKATDNEGSVTTSSTVTIIVQNTPPTVSITTPSSGNTFTAPATIDITADAADANGSVAKVEFFKGTTKLGEDLTSPYAFTWSDVAAGSYSLTAKATDDLGAVTTSSAVNIIVSDPSGLPAPWVNQDIGAVAAAGSASHSSGTFTVNGSGADIWGTADEFHYVHQPVSGDVEIIARVGSLTNSNGWAKAGVMIRESLAAGSMHAAVYVTPVNGVTFQRRTATDGTSTSTASTGAAPVWLKMTRAGNNFTAASSTNGTTWTTIGTVAIMMNANVQIGLALTSHADGTLATATFSNVSVSGANAAPTVSISSPANNSTFATPATVSINANAADSDGTVTKVEFFNGATKLGEDLSAPYSFSWNNVAAGSYSLTAVATDNGGRSTTSTSVAITVNPCDVVIASADDGNVAANVLDNNLATRWSASGDPQWIKFCLASTQSVSGVQIAFFKGNERASSFDVELSLDGTTFTPAAPRFTSSGTSLALETFSFAAQNARYVRIVGHGNSLNLWNSYTEVEINAAAPLSGSESATARQRSAEEVETSSTNEPDLSCHPNPTHGLMTITYKVKEDGWVKLSVDNSTNNQKFILVDKHLSAGTYQSTFDTKPLPRGVHIIKLVSNGKLKTHKLMKQ